MQTLRRPPDTAAQIARLIAEVEQKKTEVNDEEIDGWLIRRPSIFEVDDHFGMLFAQSTAGSAPLVLPQSRELCLSVITGEVRIHGYPGTVTAGHHFVLRPKDSRTVIAVQQPTLISALFFLEAGDGQAAELGS